jgi:LmbE family N-acetylglucosaminyl deacetylase
VFAHQDDEYAAVPWLLEECAEGSDIACLYLTDGARRATAEQRDAETRDVLNALGIGEGSIVNLTVGGKRISDGRLPERSLDALTALETWIEQGKFVPRRIYAPSYEGGHPDHDAAHLIAAALATKLGIAGDAWHVSLYNAYGCPRPFYSTMRQLPGSAPQRVAAMAARLRWSTAWLCFRYRSQLRTWLGLFPGAFYARVIARNERAVRFDLARLTARPHAGELLYERMFGTTYAQFEEQTRAVRARL